VTALVLEIVDDIGLNSPVKVTIVQEGEISEVPFTPKRARDSLIGLILGLGFGAAFIRLFGLLDRRVKNETHLEGIPLLGTVRFDSHFQEHPTIANLETYSERVESFRAIRGNINFLRKGKGNFVLLVTSTLPKEGKSTTSINLGISFAKAGIKTLIIESDMRKPSIASYCRDSNIAVIGNELGGLSGLLSSPTPITSTNIGKFSLKLSDLGSLRILTAGKVPPNPSELMSGTRMLKLLDVAAKNYDLVIVDTPPVGLVSDATGIAAAVTARVVLVAAGQTKVEEFRVALRVMENVGQKFDGVILNKIPRKRNQEYGYGDLSYGGYSQLNNDYLSEKYSGYYDGSKDVSDSKTSLSFIGDLFRYPIVKISSFLFGSRKVVRTKLRNLLKRSVKNPPPMSRLTFDEEVDRIFSAVSNGKRDPK
jgi:capsular exopolysaccharide synthesis family protein